VQHLSEEKFSNKSEFFVKKFVKRLFSDTVVYGIGGVLSKSISFFLLPVYTRIFSPADYGTISFLVVITNFIGVLMTMGMGGAQSFYFFEQKKNGIKNQREVVSSILQFRLSWGVVIVLISTLVSAPINSFFFKGELTIWFFLISFSGAFFLRIMNQSAQLFRLLYRPWKYFGIMFFQTILSAALILLLVLIFNKGIIGYFLGTMVGSLFAAVFGWIMIREYIDFSGFHLNWWPRILKFGAPLVPAEIINYVLTTSDRWFITHYNSTEELGIYAVGAKFAMMITMVVTTFRLAWWPIALDAMNSDDGNVLFRHMARIYLGVGIIGIVILSAISRNLIFVFTGPGYTDAFVIVGVLSWFSVFYGFFLIASAGIWKSEKTYLTSILMGIAAIVNIGLNWYLVPIYGGLGAAFATSISFFIWNLLGIIVSERLWFVGYNYWSMAFQIFVGILTCFFIYYFDFNNYSPVYKILLSIVTVLLLIYLSLSKGMIKSIKNSIKKKQD